MQRLEQAEDFEAEKKRIHNRYALDLRWRFTHACAWDPVPSAGGGGFFCGLCGGATLGWRSHVWAALSGVALGTDEPSY